MIIVTRLDGKELVINSDQILTLERTPDTKVTLGNGVHLLVKETVEQVIDRTVAFRRRIAAPEGPPG